MSTHSATVTPRTNNPIHWSDFQIGCAADGWKSPAISYVQQVADYQTHKKS